MDKAQYTQEIVTLLEKCNEETASSIYQLNCALVGLTAAQLVYLIELVHLLFGKPPQ